MNKDKDKKLDFSDLDSVSDFIENEAPTETELKRSQSIKNAFLRPDVKENYQKGLKKRNKDSEWRKNVSKAAAQNFKDMHNDPEHREKYLASRARLKADPEHHAKMVKNNRELAKDPKWHEALVKSRNNHKDSGSEWYNKIVKANQKKAAKFKDPTTEEYKNYMAGRERMKNNPEWRANVVRAKAKPICTPLGVFISAKAGEDVYNEQINKERGTTNYRNAYKLLLKWCKDPDNKDFYYITLEEYDSIKEKE